MVVNYQLDAEKLLLKWFKSAMHDKKILIELKNAAIKSHQFELAVNLRKIEKQFKTESND